jgi:hypothetical protein
MYNENCIICVKAETTRLGWPSVVRRTIRHGVRTIRKVVFSLESNQLLPSDVFLREPCARILEQSMGAIGTEYRNKMVVPGRQAT